MSGLILIGLPIGNFQDITIRVLETLKTGKYFYAEDTRVFKELLDYFDIDYGHKIIDSFHDHSEGKIENILTLIKNGNDIHLVSDAGSPIISDPAFPLVKRVQEEQLTIQTIPGVTSVITALELSGLPPHPFMFWGFIARTKGEKLKFFRNATSIQGTHIFFESPHRIYETIELFFEIFPEKTLVITRELTKKFETVTRITKSNLSNLHESVLDKGEFVLLFHQNESSDSTGNIEVKELVTDYLENGGGTKKLSKIFSKILGDDAKLIYNKLKES